MSTNPLVDFDIFPLFRVELARGSGSGPALMETYIRASSEAVARAEAAKRHPGYNPVGFPKRVDNGKGR